MRTRRPTATIAGLVVAWGGIILLLGPAARFLGEPGQLSTALLAQALLWFLAATVLAIVLIWERQPLGSLWLRRFRWQSIGWGVLLAAVQFFILFPVDQWVRRATGLPGLSSGMERVITYPIAYRIFAVLGAGIVEELLFRGYTVTRLTWLTGRVWLAAALALAGFSLLHVPVWGWGFALGGLVSGAVAMAFFVWRKDLLAMIVFHTITDAIGLVIAPLFSEWWREAPL